MAAKEPDYTKIIVQKLEIVEDFLRSFMHRLEEPLQKQKKRLHEIYAPATGRVLKWHRTGGLVVEGEKLCRFEYLSIPFTVDISSPSSGLLRVEPWIRVGETVVSMGETIATVEEGLPV